MSIEETLAAEAASAEADRGTSAGVPAQRSSRSGNPAALSVRVMKEKHDEGSE